VDSDKNVEQNQESIVF